MRCCLAMYCGIELFAAAEEGQAKDGLNERVLPQGETEMDNGIMGITTD